MRHVIYTHQPTKLHVNPRVLYLSPYYWPEEIGSAPYCTQLAEHLVDKGLNVDVVSFRPHYPDASNFADWSNGARDRETINGVRIERVPTRERSRGTFAERTFNDVRYLLRSLRSALTYKANQYDTIVVYVPSILTLFAAKATQLRSKSRIVAVVHDIESGLAESLEITKNKLLLSAMRLGEKIGFSFADQIVVLTDGMETELRKLGCKKPITVISIWAKPYPRSLITENNTVTVMYSGNLGKKQNLAQLTPLLHHINAARPDVKLIFKGNGSNRRQLEQLYQEHGIKNLSFTDLAPADALMESLQSANVHLVPQALNVANYALPSKLFSIMAAGRPFVCIAEQGSPLDLIAKKSEAGIAVPPDQMGRLCEEVSVLLADLDMQQRMGDAGRKFVAENMNRSAILETYTSIIRN